MFSIKIKFDMLLKDLKSYNIPLNSIKLFYFIFFFISKFWNNHFIIYFFILRISGGVAQSDFLCQYLSNLLQFSIERSEISSSTSLYGAAFLAGLGAKIWNDVEVLKKFRKNVKIFTPNTSITNNATNIYNENYLSEWKNALQRHINWYKPL